MQMPFAIAAPKQAMAQGGATMPHLGAATVTDALVALACGYRTAGGQGASAAGERPGGLGRNRAQTVRSARSFAPRLAQPGDDSGQCQRRRQREQRRDVRADPPVL